jgi:hypothetical protein
VYVAVVCQCRGLFVPCSKILEEQSTTETGNNIDDVY